MCNIVPTFIYDNYTNTNFQKETLADVWRSGVKNSFSVPFFVPGYEICFKFKIQKQAEPRSLCMMEWGLLSCSNTFPVIVGSYSLKKKKN